MAKVQPVRSYSISPPTKPRPSPSPPFHVKRRRGSIATSRCSWEWQAKTNLVAPSTLPHLWTRHIADSLQLLDLAPVGENLGRPRQRRRLSRRRAGLRPGGDAGRQCPSGRAQSPRRRPFCAKQFASLSAAATVHLAEIGDNVDRIGGPVDCVTARALAPLHQLIGFAEPLVSEGAKALFLKGQDVEAELTEATKYWNIEPQLHSSRTGGHGWIVELDRIERRNPSAITYGDRA